MNDPAFVRDRHVDKPGIVGARWWNAALKDSLSKMRRREALRNILIAGGVIAGIGAIAAGIFEAAKSSEPDTREERRGALDMQKAYGWQFGASDQSLVFDGVSTTPLEPGSALPTIAADMAPADGAHTRFYKTTLFDAPIATPTSLSSLPKEEATAFRPLVMSQKPVHTDAMDRAYSRGQRVGRLADGKTALIVDLPGAEAVAFAAGAASDFDPIFLFDNWPHPRGVVPAHQTLGAAAYYQPLFARTRKKSGKPAMFVLDRARLTAYTDDASSFDNRHVGRLPTSAQMKGFGVSRIVYVPPLWSDVELDDVNDDLVDYRRNSIDLQLEALSGFDDSAPKPFPVSSRKSAYSTGSTAATNRARPMSFATVPVMVAVAGGAILGAKMSRSGSWNRSTGGSGG